MKRGHDALEEIRSGAVPPDLTPEEMGRWQMNYSQLLAHIVGQAAALASTTPVPAAADLASFEAVERHLVALTKAPRAVASQASQWELLAAVLSHATNEPERRSALLAQIRYSALARACAVRALTCRDTQATHRGVDAAVRGGRCPRGGRAHRLGRGGRNGALVRAAIRGLRRSGEGQRAGLVAQANSAKVS